MKNILFNYIFRIRLNVNYKFARTICCNYNYNTNLQFCTRQRITNFLIAKHNVDFKRLFCDHKEIQHKQLNNDVNDVQEYTEELIDNENDEDYESDYEKNEDEEDERFTKNIEYDDEVEKVMKRDSEFQQLYPKHWIIPDSGHNVFIILPRQKWGNQGMTRDAAVHYLAESITLVKTMPNWNVIGSTVVSTTTLRKKRVFGSGNLSLLVSKVKSNRLISAVFFVIDILSHEQQAELEQQFGVPVFDRYSIVLQIFHKHAKTKEAKLQVALAEIPYIKNTLRSMEISKKTLLTPVIKHVGGPGETWIQTRNEMLKEREIKIKKFLDKIEQNREKTKQNRIKKEIPIVAVVGYTNSGKTSLIKALTHDERLQPKNVLFATLDVSVHAGQLPSSNSQILYTDTIGFISYIPTTLIQSFNATLKDISLANLIVHVCDASHPNYHLQRRTVHQTLKEINVSDELIGSMIEVYNKIDLVENHEDFQDQDNISVSATKGTNLNNLLKVIEEKIMENTGRFITTFRVPNGGIEYRWLYKEAGLIKCEADPKDYNFLLMNVILTKKVFYKFKHYFPEYSQSVNV